MAAVFILLQILMWNYAIATQVKEVLYLLSIV